ncbi:MAG: hypothetical protein Q9162_003162 [Coniocarpon cinnabarinum]
MEETHELLQRKRKGSLRKSVLLGVERLRGDRRSSLSTVTNARKSPTKSEAQAEPPAKPLTFELPNSSTESYASDGKPTAPIVHSFLPNGNGPIAEATTHDIISPTSTHTSATSDDDVLSMPLSTSTVSTNAANLDPRGLRSPAFFPPPIAPVSPSPSPPSSESSSPAAVFAANESTMRNRRRSTIRSAVVKSSPLTTIPAIQTLPPIEEERDYGDTEWWGWIILVVTWIVFVVGMGSCLGVWSWAWDVGETPYAPPELEDDPTLPIVGYYPALLVLTAVMSWIWVIIAWMGLKYFKHAKMGVVEDT